jgi:hypothetical protein
MDNQPASPDQVIEIIKRTIEAPKDIKITYADAP